MQHHVHYHQVDAGVFQRQAVHVALAYVDMRIVRAFQITTRQCQHVVVQIYADTAPYAWGEQLQYAPGAGAYVEQLVYRLIADQLDQFLLNLRLRHVERTDGIPGTGHGGEIFLCFLRTRVAHLLQARVIAGERAVGLRHQLQQRTRHGR